MQDLPHSPGPITRAFHYTSKFAALVVASIGLLVLLSWALNIAVLKTVLPGLVSMKATTALCLFLSGVALWFDHLRVERGWVIVMTVGGVVATIGALSLTQYVWIFDAGINQLLANYPASSDQTSFAGRSSLITALGSVLIGLALVCLNSRRGYLFSQAFSLTTGGLFLIALLGYLFGVRAPYATAAYNPVVLNTALAFVLLSGGVLFRHPDRGVMSVVGGAGTGAHMARQLVLPALCLPVFLGWITILGQHAGMYEMEFGHTVYTSAILAMLAAGVWWSARELDRIDEGRIQALESDAVHKRTEAIFRALLETAPEAVIIVNRESRVHRAEAGVVAVDGPCMHLQRAPPGDLDRIREDVSIGGEAAYYWPQRRPIAGSVWMKVDGATLEEAHFAYRAVGKDVTPVVIRRRQIDPAEAAPLDDVVENGVESLVDQIRGEKVNRGPHSRTLRTGARGCRGRWRPIEGCRLQIRLLRTSAMILSLEGM